MEGVNIIETPSEKLNIFQFMGDVFTFDFNKFLEETKNNSNTKIYVNLTLDASLMNNPKFTREFKKFMKEELYKPEQGEYDYFYNYDFIGIYNHTIGINLVIAPELLTKEQQLRECRNEYDEICQQSRKWLETYKKLIAYQEDNWDYELSLDIKKLENILLDMIEQMDKIDKDIKNLINN